MLQGSGTATTRNIEFTRAGFIPKMEQYRRTVARAPDVQEVWLLLAAFARYSERGHLLGVFNPNRVARALT
jgi:hypothetical protein